MNTTIEPQLPPALHLPASSSIVHVKALDSTTKLVCEADAFVRPPIKGHELLNLPTLCFLIEHETSGKRVLFDCGSRKDHWNFSPRIRHMIETTIPGLEVKQGVDEVLVEAGISLASLDAIVWSHWHWDHIGDGSKFPSSVDIIVGPGFKENFLPGFPTNPESPVLETDYEGHQLREIRFDSQFQIGIFAAHDYFGDGSFYLLDFPGHAIGHICGLVRTTPTTFVLFGADSCHFGGNFRPSIHNPLPENLPSAILGRPSSNACPCSMFNSCHPIVTSSQALVDGSSTELQTLARTSPYYKSSTHKNAAYIDPPTADQSIDGLMEFDASPDVFVCITHDNGLPSVLPLINDRKDATSNDWKEKKYKEMAMWRFLNELPQYE